MGTKAAMQNTLFQALTKWGSMFWSYLLTLFLIFSLTPFTNAQERSVPLGANWELPGFDPFNTNFNPQTQITNENVADMQLKWVYQVPAKPAGVEKGVAPEGIQTTPMLINGIVYFATGYNRLIALEATTGREVWSFQPNITSYFAKSWWSGRFATRSLTLHRGILYMQGNDCSIYGLEPTTGELKFQLPDTCKDIPGNTGQYFGVMSPVFYKDILITRSNGGFYGARGFVAAYDLHTEQILWRWYSVPPAGGEPDWGLKDAEKGNIKPYKGDWGSSELIGGGTPWGYMALDEETGLVYTNTGEPASPFDAALRPGPNLFTTSVVALEGKTGELVWYYQTAPHDINTHDPVWSIILAKVTTGGVERKVVISASKSNYVYVLDARTGKPVYDPVKIGPPSINTPNDNAGNSANLTLSQRVLLGKTHCPGQLGGPFAHPAFAYNTIFVSTQNECGTVELAKLPYKGKTLDGFVYRLPATTQQNSSIFALDASTGKIRWEFFIPNRFQSAALTVSGKVLYAIDRVGTFYAIDVDTGKLLRSIPFNSFGSAGVGIGADARGNMMILVVTGGAELVEERSGVVAAFGLPSETKRTNVSNTNEVALAALAVAAVHAGRTTLLIRQVCAVALRASLLDGHLSAVWDVILAESPGNDAREGKEIAVLVFSQLFDQVLDWCAVPEGQ